MTRPNKRCVPEQHQQWGVGEAAAEEEAEGGAGADHDRAHPPPGWFQSHKVDQNTSFLSQQKIFLSVCSMTMMIIIFSKIALQCKFVLTN
mmetsp:Transcript_31991/g.42218  ORF Transcript_31991/g.42218 Transcript_31991/m.42218 type:complete len:90 (+) Transcript_31991:377-646(+)